MEKINIAELLKDCPKGMELDCTMFDNVTFDGINIINSIYYISIKIEEGAYYDLTEYGQWYYTDNAKCIIFPKGKTTWEGFVPPCKFKDGDIVYVKTKGHNHNEYIIIFKEIRNDHIHKYACFSYQHLSIDKCALCHLVDAEIMRLATEEEKQKLFDAIKANGYKWNTETKTLEKLIEPKFKVGDRIKHKTYIEQENVVTEIKDTHYILDDEMALPFVFQDEYELIPNKFDINTLVPFESRVLVRDKNTEKWKSNFWGFYDIDNAMNYPYECCGSSFAQCIPYEGNQHLLGETCDCNEYYKTWEE